MGDGRLSRETGGYWLSVTACYGSSLGLNPDISQGIPDAVAALCVPRCCTHATSSQVAQLPFKTVLGGWTGKALHLRGGVLAL